MKTFECDGVPLRGRRRARPEGHAGRRAREDGGRRAPQARGAARAHGRDPVRRAPRHAPRAEHRGARASGPGQPRAARPRRRAARRARERRARRGAEPVPGGARRARAGAARRAERPSRSARRRSPRRRSGSRRGRTTRRPRSGPGRRARSCIRLGLSPGGGRGTAARGGAGGRGGLVLRAPAAGIVLEMHAVPGELVRPDQAILTVGDLSDLWLWADLYEDQLGRVVLRVPGERCVPAITVKAFPGEVFPGTVDFVGPTMDEKTRTVKVRIAREEPRRRSSGPGCSPPSQLYLPGDEEALAVPRAAVLDGRGALLRLRPPPRRVLRPPARSRPGRTSGRLGRGEEGARAAARRWSPNGAFLLKSDVLRSKMGAGCAD